MDRQESTLSTYLKRVMALKDERRQIPSEEELRSIAREIGLSDEDLAAIDQAAEDHAVRGQGFLEHERYGDAITELEEAVAIAPRRLEWQHALARAHLGRWQEQGATANRERAERLARECLEIDPRHSASYEVLNVLDSSPGATPGRSKRIAVLPSLFALAMLLTVIIFGIVVWNSQPSASQPSASKPSASKPNTETPAAGSPAAGSPAPETAGVPPAAAGAGESRTPASARELDVPVTFDPGTTGVAVELDTRLSRLASYGSGKAFYTLNAILSNRGAIELDKLGGTLELLDEAGTVVDRGRFEVLNQAAPVLRPGDAHALHRLVETGGSVRAARLVAEIVEQNPAASSYAAAEPLDFEWRVGRTADLEIALRERSVRFSENSLAKDGSGYFDAVVEVENTGGRTIRALKLEAEIAGPGGAWTVTEVGHIATSSGPALRPGEIRLKRFIEKVEARPEGYRVFVVAVQ